MTRILTHVPKLTWAERPKQNERGSLLSAAETLALTHNTSAIARRVVGQSHVYAYATQEHTPRCISKDGNDFYIVDDATMAGVPLYQRKVEFQLPWYMSKGYSILGVRLMAMTNVSWPISISVSTGTLIDSVATVQSRPSAPVTTMSGSYPLQGNALPPGSKDNPRFFAPINLFIKPTLPSTREVAVKFHMHFYQSIGENGAFSFGNVQMQCWLTSIAMWDHPAEEDIG